VAQELRKRTTAEWQQALKAADIPVFPMHTFESLLQDEHLRDIGFFREVEHPHVGMVRETAVPSEWHGTPPTGYRPPPLLGEHSREILSQAGYREDEIEEFLRTGVSAQAHP